MEFCCSLLVLVGVLLLLAHVGCPLLVWTVVVGGWLAFIGAPTFVWVPLAIIAASSGSSETICGTATLHEAPQTFTTHPPIIVLTP